MDWGRATERERLRARPEEPPTEAQLRFIDGLARQTGKAVVAPATKRKATVVIDQLLRERDRQNRRKVRP